jgi:hypothetical protein
VFSFKRETKVCILLIGLLSLAFILNPSQDTDKTEHYLLMQPIAEAINTGDFSHFKEISEDKISINFEPPFKLKGYVTIHRFIDEFSAIYALFKADELEWTSKQIGENFGVQSLNVILRNRKSEKEIYYKLIFFMKKEIEWKIYYLKGLKI